MDDKKTQPAEPADNKSDTSDDNQRGKQSGFVGTKEIWARIDKEKSECRHIVMYPHIDEYAHTGECLCFPIIELSEQDIKDGTVSAPARLIKVDIRTGETLNEDEISGDTDEQNEERLKYDPKTSRIQKTEANVDEMFALIDMIRIGYIETDDCDYFAGGEIPLWAYFKYANTVMDMTPHKCRHLYSRYFPIWIIYEDLSTVIYDRKKGNVCAFQPDGKPQWDSRDLLGSHIRVTCFDNGNEPDQIRVVGDSRDSDGKVILKEYIIDTRTQEVVNGGSNT